jgi:hypothetical protein
LSVVGAAVLLVVLGLLAWVLIGWPAELFNSTFAENEAVIRGWFRRRRPRERRRPDERRAPQQHASWPVVTFFSVISALIVALAEPGPVWDRERTVTVLGLIVAIPLVAVTFEFAVESYLRRGAAGAGARLRISYPALALAVVCACMSRILAFVPGYAYGLIIGYAQVKDRREDTRREAVGVLRATGILLVMAVASWLLRQFATAQAAAGDGTPIGLRFIDTVLGLTTTMCLETLVIGLVPLRFMTGNTLWRWSRAGWVAAYLPGAALFVLILIGPLPHGETTLATVGHLIRMLWLFVGFGLGSLLFWSLFALRRIYAQHQHAAHARPAPVDTLARDTPSAPGQGGSPLRVVPAGVAGSPPASEGPGRRSAPSTPQPPYAAPAVMRTPRSSQVHPRERRCRAWTAGRIAGAVQALQGSEPGGRRGLRRRLDTPDQCAILVQGDGLRVLVDEALVGDERVALGGVEERPVDVVDPRLDLSGVLASSQRSGPGPEADLEVRVRLRHRRGEDHEPGRDVAAAHLGPVTLEHQRVGGGRVGEPVPHRHRTQRHRARAGVDDLVQRVQRVVGILVVMRAVLDLQSALRSRQDTALGSRHGAEDEQRRQQAGP